MANVTSLPSSSIELNLNPTVLRQPASITITATATPGEYQMKMAGGLPVTFQSGHAQVSFSADAGSLLAVYGDAASLLAKLTENINFAQDLALVLGFPAQPDTSFGMLRCPYDLTGSAGGSMALGAGASASLGVDTSQKGFFAVVREISSAVDTTEMLADVVQSWRLPRQVRTLDDIHPGTWIIAEANGSLNLKASAKYGYDMTWIRQVTGGVLKGDIGLRVQAGLEAQLGMHAAGQYAVILSRSSQPQIRLQLFRLSSRGWDAGLRGGVTLAPNEGYQPPSLDDLIKGILGIHPAQILAGLKGVEQWIRPDKPLFGPLANLAPQIAADIVRSLTGVSDLVPGFEVAKSILQSATPLDATLTEINRRLDLNQLAHAAQSGDLSQLDPWLLGRLQDFFGNPSFTPENLKTLRQKLQNLTGLKDTLYTKSLEALKRQYDFSFTAAYQSASTDSALLDLVFDFAENSAAAEEGLRLALDGRFDLVVESENPSLTVNQGILTHGIHHESSVDVALPFFDSTQIHVTDSLAAMNAADHSDGRVVIYNGAASDLVEVKNQAQSSLSISLTLPANGDRGLIVHNQPQATYSYSLPMALRQLTRAGLKARFTAELEQFFPQLTGNLDQWIDSLIGPGNDQIGNTIVRLDASLPPEYVQAWLKAPAAKGATSYKTMSVALQNNFREFLLRQYFADSENYADVADGSPAFDLLVFASTPRVTKVSADLQFPPNNGDEVYWDYQDTQLRRDVLGHPATVAKLMEQLMNVRATLSADARTDLIRYYTGEEVSRIISSAQASTAIKSLFFVEARLVEQARHAAMTLAQFQETKTSNPAMARAALASFGSELTATFNSSVRNYATGLALLPLGTFLFAAAARVFDPALKPPPKAMFSLVTVKGPDFPPPGFPQNPLVSPQDISVEARIVPVTIGS